jgi:hypothetical protein
MFFLLKSEAVRSDFEPPLLYEKNYFWRNSLVNCKGSNAITNRRERHPSKKFYLLL